MKWSPRGRLTWQAEASRARPLPGLLALPRAAVSTRGTGEIVIMAEHRLRDLLRRHETAFGTFIFSPDPATTEAAAVAGFDFVIVDTEHAVLSPADILGHCRAAEAHGVTALARVDAPDVQRIARLLDYGAQGIVIPHLGLDPERTRAAVRALRYAPRGARPTCTGVRAAGYGQRDFAAYAAAHNDAVLAIGLIEDPEVVERIEPLLAELEIDALMPGPEDLSVAYGVAGQTQHPLVLAAVQRVIAAAKRRGLALGMYVNAPEEVSRWRDFGFDFFVYAIDYRVLASAYRQARAALAEMLATRPTPV